MEMAVGRVTASGKLFIWMVTVMGVTAMSACSSSGPLTAEQKKDIVELSGLYDVSHNVIADAFDPAVSVPLIEAWQEAEDAHQAALAQLQADLPAGECRTAIEALQAIEVTQNEVRSRILESARQDDLERLSEESAAYGRTVLMGALQAEAAVLPACGRSSVDPAASAEVATPLTPTQVKAMEAVQAAYEATRVAFDATLDIEAFVGDVENLQAADARLANKLEEIVASLDPGECRSSLEGILELEEEQAPIRQRIIDAGKVGDRPTMITAHEEYLEIYEPSGIFVAARNAVREDCGIDL